MLNTFEIENSLTQFFNERKEYVGPFLQTMRMAYDITQQELSEATGYSVQTISRIENGKANPTGIAGRDIFRYLLDTSGNTQNEILQEFENFCMNMKAAESYDERISQ